MKYRMGQTEIFILINSGFRAWADLGQSGDTAQFWICRGPVACVGLTVNWKSFFEAKERGLG